ncbi:tRNA (adenosine(37)-N6)-threonylcarbamoyltransferase complex dimerization subunit type 1 TsaB [Salipaludibacillus sp. CUR1]|uniref:tRNA (adenosine(37)-N6)-threonylcarbamoyltransferase complex dimerization subunit type 1 TsaB n=1 Tax=Salipaludibacillus sp. CUR1 TaxID=2820003 RepID=UPI001E301FC1|nr:tRNA (adenosine(37)-N6)-threonylcarbamoyltransferase complex dimerization subunit type 1 TsaB [Salipaludibacillus sp. CUR1]MCE7790816.1 tRNA (adenosine(37)-N6)-threonylcarbamoyltransferase complex dimerization subunit type 1 TsaB [Salipaludibacillus sp. CUR1]
MNILAVDTASYVMGVALLKDGNPLGEIVTHQKKNHSVRLMPAIRTLFSETDMKPGDLDRIVVSEGPGSYTGVRIGVTTAKTMAWALNIPVIGVSSMEMLAQNARHFQGVISPFFDARRGQVFTGLYRSEGGRIIQEEEDRITMHKDWLQLLKEKEEPVIFLSPDIGQHASLIKEELGEWATAASSIGNLPRPLELAAAGMDKAPGDSPHTFSPNYLRMAEAEAKWLKANKKNKED